MTYKCVHCGAETQSGNTHGWLVYGSPNWFSCNGLDCRQKTETAAEEARKKGNPYTVTTVQNWEHNQGLR